MLLADLMDLVLPATCAGCEEPSSGALCGPCREALHAARPQRTRPEPEPAGLPATYALAAYAGALRRAILQYKEENRHELTTVLGGLLAAVVRRSLRGWSGPVLLVPVPATAAAARKRHGDHIVRLARAAARVLPDATVTVPLRALPKQAGDSTELSAVERAAAARHAFAVRPHRTAPLRSGKAIVLVDDIVTTGVTLAASAERLTAAGVRVNRAAVLAATQRQR
jgi:predicted amidophosphoribosyltransferase